MKKIEAFLFSFLFVLLSERKDVQNDYMANRERADGLAVLLLLPN